MPRLVTWSEREEELAIGSINASFIKNNKPYYVIASLRAATPALAPGASVSSNL
jgi:hypothetical protein